MDSNCEAYFKHSIKMALENNFSWTTLAFMLDEMTPTLSKTKQLVKVLLEELQKLQKEHQQMVQNPSQPNEDEVEIQEVEIMHGQNMIENETENNKEGTENDDPKMKEFSEDEIVEDIEIEKEGILNDEPEIIEETFEDVVSEHQEVEDRYEHNTHDETYNLKDFYTYVDNSKMKFNDIENECSDPDPRNDCTNNLECDASSKHFVQEYDISEKNSKVTFLEANKKFECNVCSKSFSTKQAMVIHGRFHSNEKPYVCNTCKMEFAWQSGLKQHEKIHSGKKPFECKTCNKTFSRLDHLRNH